MLPTDTWWWGGTFGEHICQMEVYELYPSGPSELLLGHIAFSGKLSILKRKLLTHLSLVKM